MNKRSFIKILAEVDVGDIFPDELLSRHCTWQIGGSADLFVVPHTVEQLTRLRRYLYDHNIASVVIGNGSNVLFADAGFRGVVVSIDRAMSKIKIDGVTVTSEAGIAVPRLARLVGLTGLTGLEYMIGIPGTLGGLVAMNGGSHRQTVGDVIREVVAMKPTGETFCIKQRDCGFSYRSSIFQNSLDIIVSVDMELQYGDVTQIRADMLADLRLRRKKFPLHFPNCGSVFASTAQMYKIVGPPGKIIEDAGLKGYRIGDAEVSHRHANFILNKGKATAADVCELIQHIRQKVYNSTDFWLTCEVKYISSDGVVRPAHETANRDV